MNRLALESVAIWQTVDGYPVDSFAVTSNMVSYIKMETNQPQQQNLIAAIAYLGGPVTGIAILLLEKYNSYIRFHAMQSTVFSFGIIVINAALGYLPLQPLNFYAGQLLTMVAFIIWLVLLYKAFTGEEYELPYVGPFVRKQLTRMS